MEIKPIPGTSVSTTLKKDIIKPVSEFIFLYESDTNRERMMNEVEKLKSFPRMI